MAIIRGKVYYLPDPPKQSRAGKEYSTFGLIDDKGKDFDVLCFDELAVQAYSNIQTEDLFVIVHGKLSKDSDGNTKIIPWKLTYRSGPSKVEEIYGSYEKLHAKLRADANSRQTQIIVDGESKPVMEWLMDSLGAEFVSDALREAGINYEGGFQGDAYKKVMREMCNLAQDKTGCTFGKQVQSSENGN
jgi:hypothetical protein